MFASQEPLFSSLPHAIGAGAAYPHPPNLHSGTCPTLAPVAFTVEDRMLLRLVYVQQKALQVQMEAILCALGQRSSAPSQAPSSFPLEWTPASLWSGATTPGAAARHELPKTSPSSGDGETNGPSPSCSPDALAGSSEGRVRETPLQRRAPSEAVSPTPHVERSGVGTPHIPTRENACASSSSQSLSGGKSSTAFSCRSHHSRTASLVGVSWNPLLSPMTNRTDASAGAPTKQSSSSDSPLHESSTTGERPSLTLSHMAAPRKLVNPTRTDAARQSSVWLTDSGRRVVLDYRKSSPWTSEAVEQTIDEEGRGKADQDLSGMGDRTGPSDTTTPGVEGSHSHPRMRPSAGFSRHLPFDSSMQEDEFNANTSGMDFLSDGSYETHEYLRRNGLLK